MAGSILSEVGPGISRGMQVAQFMEEKRNREWQKKYQVAALGVSVAANKDMPVSIRLNGLNKGLLPLWNDPNFNVNGNNSTPLPNFTEGDLQDNSFQDVLSRAKAIGSDKNTPPELKRDALVNLFVEWHAQRGETQEAMKLMLSGAESGVKDKNSDDKEALIKERLSLAEDRQKALEEERSFKADERRKARFKNYLETIELKDPIIKEAKKQSLLLSDFDGLMELVNQGNTIAFSTMGAKAARALAREVGVLTEEDIARYVRSGRLDRKAADTLSKWTTGKSTQATIDEIGQIADVMKDTYESKIQPQYDKWIERYSKIEKVEPEQFAAEIGVPYLGGKKEKQGGDGKPDSTGYVIGQSYKMKDGNMATYKGNGVFE